MTKFYSLQVVDVTKETPDAVSIAFNVPAELKNDYLFKQGQYLTLKFKLNNEEYRRSYSICSAVDDNELRVAVKRVANGVISNHIFNSVKAGDSIEVMVPMGNFFTELNSLNTLHYLLFAGGSGITPMFSIIKTVLVKEPGSKITLFYGNNDESSIIFKKQLDNLATSYPARLSVLHVLNQPPAGHPPLLQGMMTVEKCTELINSYISASAAKKEYFICGPAKMMENTLTALKQLNIPEDKIHIEYFLAPADGDKKNENVEVAAADEAVVATIIIDGDQHQVKLHNNETILEAALRIGLDAPYACQGGSCCTCRALLQSGKVTMSVNYALSAAEVKQGYILTCQSKPTTPEVTVNYDKAN